MRLKLLTLIEPALLPACVCNYKRTLLKLQTLIEPASLPQFQLCGTCKYCVEAAQLLVILSFTDTVHCSESWLAASPAWWWSKHALLTPWTNIHYYQYYQYLLPNARIWDQRLLGFTLFRLSPLLGGHHQVLTRRSALPLMSPRNSHWQRCLVEGLYRAAACSWWSCVSNPSLLRVLSQYYWHTGLIMCQ